MPKKTKKEKLLSEYRKRLKLLDLLKKDVQKEESLEIAKTKEQKSIPKIETSARENKNEKIYFIKDLRKSIFFTAVIIALEIAIYFGTIIKS